ncbi:unnamed protein product [Mytilus coruscus]|uniref:DZIP3-like HEPN domain-containing protein n=1 Tax=Mytilus coruscus TaxID=42192 RepID=A0A6J8ERK0_MYTCO|nr:unnamed protein product [Mytilus coruscus]
MATAGSTGNNTGKIKTNYARLGHAVQDELQNLLRELLVFKEPPHLLDGHVHANQYLSKNLRPHEWAVIQGVQTNLYNNVDVSLMYKIIRNLNLVPPPTRGWDNQIHPMVSEITIGDDIERIRHRRNEIVHRGNTKVDNSELANYFLLFKDIAGRFEMYLCKQNQELVSRISTLKPAVWMKKRKRCISKDY